MPGGVIWPLMFNTIREGSVRNTFGLVRTNADGSPRPHQGWDFAAPLSTLTHAIGDGKVAFVRNTGAYGLQVCIRFRFRDATLYAFYAHLSHAYVATGDDVKMGDVVGTTGQSGNALNTPPHLHFELREWAECGLGLDGRRSPLTVYGFCPLKTVIVQVPLEYAGHGSVTV